MSFTTSKKRKHDSATPGQSKRPKKSKRNEKPSEYAKTSDKKDKGKSRVADGEFTVVQSTLRLSIAPVFADNPKAGAEEMLDSMVMRYIPAFRGIVLAHSNLHFLRPTGNIISDCPFLVCDIGFDATVWSPNVGLRLTGRINLCSPDHISLLVHRTFNVSIPRHHIPTDEWEFEYGPAENDPEFGPNAVQDDEEDPTGRTSEEQEHIPGGKWVHKITGDILGGPDGHLEFTVIGLIVANEMLSLLGSIQFNPFSPEHVPVKAPPPSSVAASEDESIPTAVEHSTDVLVDEDDDSEDNDPFHRPGKMTNATAARKRKAEATEEREKKKRPKGEKKKRKEKPKQKKS